MSEIQIDIRFSNAILAANEAKVGDEMITIASLMSVSQQLHTKSNDVSAF